MAHAEQVDLIVMATHAHHGRFHGSMAGNIFQQARCRSWFSGKGSRPRSSSVWHRPAMPAVAGLSRPPVGRSYDPPGASLFENRSVISPVSLSAARCLSHLSPGRPVSRNRDRHSVGWVTSRRARSETTLERFTWRCQGGGAHARMRPRWPEQLLSVLRRLAAPLLQFGRRPASAPAPMIRLLPFRV